MQSVIYSYLVYLTDYLRVICVLPIPFQLDSTTKTTELTYCPFFREVLIVLETECRNF